MNVIVICIYNRVQNLKHWLHCWKQCVQSAQLVIIHSTDGERYEVPDGVIYLPRPNVGYDIGKFQDVCMGRMPGFPEWDKLLWITDDVFPMSKDFATPFFKQLDDNKVGVSCMEISPYVRRHIRTTGFAIRRVDAEKLTFPCDPVVTKEQCYQFEHRSNNLFYGQIERMGLRVVMPAIPAQSPLFDTGYHRRLKQRERDHYALFGRDSGPVIQPSIELPIVATDHLPKVVFICPIYDKYPQIISSLLCQTYQNWELYLIHDGPNELSLPDDPRIKYERRTRTGNDYGHSIRKEWLQKVEGDYITITNPDNYYVPVFIEYMLKGFKPGIVATYCSSMVHSYKAWDIIPCRLQRGYVDCGGVMLRLEDAKAVGWNNTTDHSADWIFFSDVIKARGIRSFAPVRGCLLVHN